MLHPEDDILHAYLDGECGDSERGEIEKHVAACTECRARLEEARGIGLEAGSLLRELEPEPVQAPPWHELEQLAAERQRTARQAEEQESAQSASVEPASRFWRMPALAWAASLVVSFGLGWMVSTEWPGVGTEPERVSMRDLQAQSELPASASGELDVADEAFELREEELRANVPAAEPAQDRPATDRDAERTVAVDELARVEAGEGNAAHLREGLEEVTPPQAPAVKVQAPAEPPAEPPADPATVVGAVSKTEAGAGRREAEAPAQVGAAQAFAARKKPDTAEAKLQQAVPTPTVAAESRQRSAVAEPEAEVGLDENVAGGTAGYRAFLDSFAAPATADESRPVSAVGFLSVSPESAEAWLGAPLRTLPDLTLLRVEVGPGSVVDGAIAGRPLVALFYEDAAGQRVTLMQQHSTGLARGFDDMRRSDAGPATIVTPSGLLAHRWRDLEYHLTLIGELSSDSLRALADRVR